MSTKVLETVLTGRNLLSPMLASASKDVVAFNSTVAGAQEKAAVSASASANRQEAATAKVAASNVKASTSASASAEQQMRAHTRTAESATRSAAVQSRASSKAAESATLSARVQETANRSLAASNGLLGTSLTPLTAGLGAVGLGLGYAAYRGMEFDSAMSQVRAATMASTGTMKQLRDAAIDQGAKTKYSSEEAAQGITEMAKAGVSTADILNGGLAGALSLAAAGQIDVADAAGVASTAMAQFNLTGKDLPHVADLLAAGAGKAMGSVGDLGAALNQAGLIASSAGLSIEETTGVLSAFAQAGLIGSDSGTSFKTMLQALQAPSSKAAGIMADLGINMYDAQGNMLGAADMAGQLQTHLSGLTEEQRNSALATIFGSDAVRAANVLYKEGAAGIQGWIDKTNDAGYAAKQASINQDNLKGDLEKLGGAFDSLMTTMGSGAQGPLREIVQMFTSILNVGGDILAFWNSLPGPVQVALVALGAVAALKNPVSSALETIALKALYMRDSVAGASIGMGGLKAAGSGLLSFFGGPWGVAITVATVAVSLLGSGIFDMGKKAADAAGFQRTLTSALKESNGAIDDNVRALAAQKAADTKIDGSSLLKWAKDAKIALPDVTDALLGNEDAFNRVMAGLEAYKKNVFNNSENYKDPNGIIANITAAESAFKALAPTVQGAMSDQQLLAAATGTTANELDKTGTAANGAATGVASVAASAEATYGSLEGYAAALGLDKDATKDLIDKSNELGQTLADFVDPLGTYTGLLQVKAQAEADAANKTAEKTGAASKSWEDFKDSVHVTFDEYMKDLEQQVTAQANWQTNMLMLAGRVSQGTLDELAKMGPEGAPLVADLVTRSDAELSRFDDVTKLRSKEATDAWGAQLTMAAPVLAAVSKKAGKGVVDQLAKELQAGTITVAQIAAKYGISLAGGINPVLTALGKRPIAGVGGRLGGLTERWVGGYTGDGGKYEPKGIVHGGEFVFTKEQTSKAGVSRLESLASSLQGYAGGGFVTAADVPRPSSTAPYRQPISTAGDATMGKEYDEVRAFMNSQASASVGPSAGAGVQRWLPVVLRSLAMVGEPASLAQTVLRRMNQESGGNPTIVNRWDSNWKRGTPSVGLMQVIGPTYRAYKDPRHDVGPYLYGTSVEGLSNVLAAHRYAKARYGSLSAAYNKSGGYDSGGLATAAGLLEKGTVKPERVLSPRQTEAFERWLAIAPAAMPGYGAGAGGGGTSTVVKVAAPDLRGLTIQGRVTVDGNGIATIAGRVVDQALGNLHDTIEYARG